MAWTLRRSEARVLQDIVTTARVHTQFIRNEVVGPNLAASDFTFKELRESPSTLFLVMPVEASAEVSKRYYRLIFSCALAEMLSEDCLGKTPVLFVLDEAASLGRMPALESAIVIARGFGVALWNIFQDAPQMKSIYGDGFRSFLANSAIRIFFPPNDVETSEEISRLAGQIEVVSRSRNVVFDRASGEPQVSVGMGAVGVPLLRPEAVRSLGAEDLLIFAQGVKGVILAKRKPYWKTHPGQFSPDPYAKCKN